MLDYVCVGGMYICVAIYTIMWAIELVVRKVIRRSRRQ